MDVNVAHLTLDCFTDVLVCVCIHVWRKSCLDTDLCCTKCSSFLCTSYYLICWQKISFLFAKVSTKCTKTALFYADIGKVDVSVNYVCYNVTYSSLSKFICNHAYQVKIKPSCIEQSGCLINRDLFFIQCVV